MLWEIYAVKGRLHPNWSFPRLKDVSVKANPAGITSKRN
jgi:hypothetical protein